MKRHLPTDTFRYDIHVPSKSVARIQRAIWAGITQVREQTGLTTGVRVKVYMMTGINKNPLQTNTPLACYGFTTTNGISFGLAPNYLRSWRFRQGLVSSSIHEYTHYLRYKHQVVQGSRTVLAGMIEEGIAIYLETVLNSAPLYIDLRMQTEKNMLIYWEKLEGVLGQMGSKTPAVLKNETYRTIYYRLGFGIVAQYMNDHPRLTLRHVVTMPRRALIAYARRGYREPQTTDGRKRTAR